MGEIEFDEYYTSLFGSRWPSLKKSLLEEKASVQFASGLSSPYFLDAASIICGKTLRLPKEGEILDSCAAPGGKTLVLTTRIGENCHILSNELSSDRRRRLSNVLDEHLTSEKRKQVTVSGFDAASAGGRQSERNRFDAILLDSPCSSERHVISTKSELDKWTFSRVKFLCQRQWSILSSCFLMLKPLGSLVYSTCALSPKENDEVVARLFKKYKEEVMLDEIVPESSNECELTELDLKDAEKTNYGIHFLPDSSNGQGPLYIARIKKMF